MRVGISINEKVQISVQSNENQKKATRSCKGNSLLESLQDYTVIDLETTGLDPMYDSIIEFGAIQYRNGAETNRFSSLVNPEYQIDEYITELTGITNDMLQNAPLMPEVLPGFLSFVGNDKLIGHNINFDVNFIYDTCEELSHPAFSNDFVDTMRFARRLFPEWKHHRLIDVAENLKIPASTMHRAIADCEITNASYRTMLDHMQQQGIDITQLTARYNLSARNLQRTTDDYIDEDNLLYGKTCVFTGTLERMPRKAAMQIVINIGGLCGDGVTKNTNFLILGNTDYSKTVGGGKSNKHKKAEAFKLAGYDIEILSEDVFYDLVSKDSTHIK